MQTQLVQQAVFPAPFHRQAGRVGLHQGWGLTTRRAAVWKGVTTVLDSKPGKKRSKDRRGNGVDVTSL